jgi:hypothetical protein
MGNSFDCQYDGILGQDSWKNRRATINYCDRTITMGEVLINFDETDKVVNETHKLMLKARTENIVQLPTKSKGHGITSKREVVPGVYLAESLTREVNGHSVTSLVNTLEEDVEIDPPHVKLHEIVTMVTLSMFSNSAVEDSSRLSKLRNELRTEHLNNVEVSLIKICEECVPFNG